MVFKYKPKKAAVEKSVISDTGTVAVAVRILEPADGESGFVSLPLQIRAITPNSYGTLLTFAGHNEELVINGEDKSEIGWYRNDKFVAKFFAFSDLQAININESEYGQRVGNLPSVCQLLGPSFTRPLLRGY